MNYRYVVISFKTPFCWLAEACKNLLFYFLPVGTFRVQGSGIVCIFAETAEKDDQGEDALDSLLNKCMPDCHDLGWRMERLDTYCPDQKRPRPVRMTFDSNSEKHTFLKHAKHLQEIGLRYDDDLTRLQQRQRQDLSADFNTLKTKL